MHCKQGQKGYMAIKIYLKKAYDRIRWAFLRETLLDMRLPQKLVEVILTCVTSTRFNVLWNGEKTEFFSPLRGVRQGDPLSPYLFILCMKRLGQLIEDSIGQGRWTPVCASHGGPALSNLLFAHDLTLFEEATREQALVIKEVLDKFCNAWGQKISFNKSRVFFSKNTNQDMANEIGVSLGIPVAEYLGRYLGMPTINGRVTKHTFKSIMNRVDQWLVG